MADGCDSEGSLYTPRILILSNKLGKHARISQPQQRKLETKWTSLKQILELDSIIQVSFRTSLTLLTMKGIGFQSKLSFMLKPDGLSREIHAFAVCFMLKLLIPLMNSIQMQSNIFLLKMQLSLKRIDIEGRNVDLAENETHWKTGLSKTSKKNRKFGKKKKAYTMMVMVTMIAVNKRGQKTNS